MGSPGVDHDKQNLREDESDPLEGIGDLGASALIGRMHGALFSSLFFRAAFWYFVIFSQAPLGLSQPSLFKLHVLVATEIQRWASGSTVTFEVESFRTKLRNSLIMGSGLDLIRAILIACTAPAIVFNMAGILTNKNVDVSAVNVLSKRRHDRKRAEGMTRRFWGVFLCCCALYFGIMAGGGLIMYAASFLSRFVGVNVILFGAALTSLLDGVLILGLWFAFQLVFAVGFLEEIHGWKALGKSWRLLKGKKWVAFQILCLNVMQICLTTFTWHWIASFIPTSVAGGFLGSISFSFFLGTETLLYFSCKALHQETFPNLDVFESEVADPEGAYEPIPNIESANSPFSRRPSVEIPT